MNKYRNQWKERDERRALRWSTSSIDTASGSEQRLLLLARNGVQNSAEPVSPLHHHHRAAPFRIWHSKSSQNPWFCMVYFNLCSFSVGISYPTWNNCLTQLWKQIPAALLLTLQLVSALPTYSRFNRRASFDSEGSFGRRGDEGSGWSGLVRRSTAASPCSLLDLDDAQQREFN